ncbi:hypothetical protein ACRALDRAFT_1091382 [Sodiomyces alcalophilus JCM 7366]|uniref:uncharacterized protein n=1 Tax=Sodiomyces alcalophilus JCM 7366 TaxID=591952 RepID=UPI0039B3F9CD
MSAPHYFGKNGNSSSMRRNIPCLSVLESSFSRHRIKAQVFYTLELPTMAPSTQAPSAVQQSQLPSTTDFNTLYNRISLATEKQSAFLAAMRAKYPSLQRPTASTSTPTTTAAAAAVSASDPPTTTKPSSFSSLNANTTGPNQPETANATNPRNPFGKTKAQLQAEHEDATFRVEPPNAGLGYRPAKSDEGDATEADATTRELGRRLLGKRGRAGWKQSEKDASSLSARSRAAARDEESDEDEGRGALVRRRKVRVVASGPDLQPAAAAVEKENADEVEVETRPADVILDANSSGDGEGGGSAVADSTSTPQPGTGDDEGGKKKRKKKNKKKKKKKQGNPDGSGS